MREMVTVSKARLEYLQMRAERADLLEEVYETPVSVARRHAQKQLTKHLMEENERLQQELNKHVTNIND